MVESQITGEIRSRLKEAHFPSSVHGLGKIIRVGDGVVSVSGIPQSFLGEILENESGFKGLVLNLTKDHGEAIVLKGLAEVRQGDEVKTTGKSLSVPSGKSILGRVVSPLGEPVDGQGLIKEEALMPIERKGPGIIDRQPVSRPLQTGIKAIDSMIPIGRGQRELIIGDRGTGKTAIAIDAIINQLSHFSERPVYCFYVAIGQKESKVAQITARLKEAGAMAYTTVVVAGAGGPASLQYLAPYGACAMAEHFLDRGLDALVVYDDLTKHAWAYRQLSLVLRRPPGREAYPGDIFYQHSRLLERAAQLSEKRGGGSLTALPVIETQAGDVSAYIPTNVISITDGQIYLERELFNAGFRPAINVGLSVSRVGGKAQVKAMKNLTGKLRLELAQYRELSAFSQFAADLDVNTREKLEKGARAMELLKQDQYSPLRVEEQVVLFWALTNGFVEDLKIEKVKGFADDLVTYLRHSQKEICQEIKESGEVGRKIDEKLKVVLKNFREVRNYA